MLMFWCLYCYFERISYLFLVSLLLTFRVYLLAWWMLQTHWVPGHTSKMEFFLRWLLIFFRLESAKKRVLYKVGSLLILLYWSGRKLEIVVAKRKPYSSNYCNVRFFFNARFPTFYLRHFIWDNSYILSERIP